DKYKLFIVVESVEDAYKLATKVNQIKTINLGLIKTRPGTHNISKSINITDEEEEMLRKLLEKGVELEIRQVPNDKKILFRSNKRGE
ncbi:PTS sugar transporter subunit IIB, partial [Bombilactobacillus bombi]|uniref:PTS sugar transporter subunit IIB n=1 Tax=Bombilactobacillus bombi TaxID=1303590 RepID=UPI0015E60CFF